MHGARSVRSRSCRRRCGRRPWPRRTRCRTRWARPMGRSAGWKVGAPSADAEPNYAPMPKLFVAPSGVALRGDAVSRSGGGGGVSAGEDLPARAHGYTRDEVLGAIASCHPAIEVLESGFVDPVAVDRLSMIGDLQMHGAFVYGPAIADWRSIDFAKESVTLAVDGSVRAEKTGSNTSGDLLRLLPYLANEGSVRTGGLEAGQWITTGSWTGNIQAIARSSVDVAFGTLGRVTVRLSRNGSWSRVCRAHRFGSCRSVNCFAAGAPVPAMLCTQARKDERNGGFWCRC